MTYSSLFPRLIAIAGIGIYGSVLYLTFSVPGWLEGFASSYIEEELTQRINTSIDNFSAPTQEGLLGDLARKAFNANEEKIDVLKARLKSKTHESMASALAKIRNMDCECRAQYAEALKKGFEFRMSSLQAANDRIVETIQKGYMGVVADLKRDVRIFSISFGIRSSPSRRHSLQKRQSDIRDTKYALQCYRLNAFCTPVLTALQCHPAADRCKIEAFQAPGVVLAGFWRRDIPSVMLS